MLRRTLLLGGLLAVFTGIRPVAADEVAIGAAGPAFTVAGTDGKEYTLDSFKDADVVVVCFTCNNCPVATGYEDRFIEFSKTYKDKKVAFIAINANSGEDLAAMQQRAEDKSLPYVYARDATGAAAKAYGARVTPHLFILNKDRKVVYRGSFDDKQAEPTKPYVTNAVDAVLAGKQPEVTTTKAFGCGIYLD